MCCSLTLLSMMQQMVGNIQMLSLSVRKGAFSASTHTKRASMWCCASSSMCSFITVPYLFESRVNSTMTCGTQGGRLEHVWLQVAERVAAGGGTCGCRRRRRRRVAGGGDLGTLLAHAEEVLLVDNLREVPVTLVGPPLHTETRRARGHALQVRASAAGAPRSLQVHFSVRVRGGGVPAAHRPSFSSPPCGWP